jgi:hypothetical protein
VHFQKLKKETRSLLYFPLLLLEHQGRTFDAIPAADGCLMLTRDRMLGDFVIDRKSEEGEGE